MQILFTCSRERHLQSHNYSHPNYLAEGRGLRSGHRVTPRQHYIQLFFFLLAHRQTQQDPTYRRSSSSLTSPTRLSDGCSKLPLTSGCRCLTPPRCRSGSRYNNDKYLPYEAGFAGRSCSRTRVEGPTAGSPYPQLAPQNVFIALMRDRVESVRPETRLRRRRNNLDDSPLSYQASARGRARFASCTM